MTINSDPGCLPRGLAMAMAKAPSRFFFPSRVQYLSLLISTLGVVNIEPHHHSSSIFLQSIFAAVRFTAGSVCVGRGGPYRWFAADGSPS